MARLWTLNGVTLPNPQGFGRRYRELSTYHEAINERTTRDISARKEVFILSYEKKKQSTVANILSQFNLKQSLTFAAEDGDLSIAETEVHVEIGNRQYSTKGSEFREDFQVILTEVE